MSSGSNNHRNHRKDRPSKKNYNSARRWEKNKERRLAKAKKREEWISTRRDNRLAAFNNGDLGHKSDLKKWSSTPVEKTTKKANGKEVTKKRGQKPVKLRELGKALKYKTRKMAQERKRARKEARATKKAKDEEKVETT